MLDLFSGIGGFALAASWIWGDEHEIVSFCDNNKAAQIALQKHWPGVPIHEDIKTLDATKWRGTVDLVTGGFPCQPFSCAGKRKGKADDRYLWPEMLRVIDECRSRWVLGENVPGIVGMELDKVLASLEDSDYECRTLIIPACAVDAPHIRSRVWIVAYNQSQRSRGNARGIGSTGRDFQEWREQVQSGVASQCSRQDVADAAGERRTGQTQFIRELSAQSKAGSRSYQWSTEPDVGRVVDGVPFRVDRLRLLGNAIVPQVAAEIMRCMKAIDEANVGIEAK